MENRTIADEFAMIAFAQIIAKFNYTPADAASEAYLYADAMMAERAKRMPKPEPEPEQSTTSVYESDEAEKLLAAMASFAGRKVTCGEIHKKAFGYEGDMASLREIGAALRQMGFAKVRSGGKDYYQL